MEQQETPERGARPYIVQHTETNEMLVINAPRYETVEGMLRAGVYRHYKSTLESLKYYEVKRVVRDTDTEECLVIYRPLYETDDASEVARPLSMFTDNVAVGKGKIPRFRFLGQHL